MAVSEAGKEGKEGGWGDCELPQQALPCGGGGGLQAGSFAFEN